MEHSIHERGGRVPESARQRGRQRRHELANGCDLAVLRNEREVCRIDCPTSLAWCVKSGVDDRTFIDQRKQRGPGRRVQHEDDIESIAGAPRFTIPYALHQFVPEPIQPELDVAVAATDSRQNVDQVLRDVHADVAMKDCPPDLKGGDQIGVDQCGGQFSRPRLQIATAPSPAS